MKSDSTRASTIPTLILSSCGYLLFLLAIIGIIARNWLGTVAAVAAGALFITSTGLGRWRLILRIVLFAALVIVFAAALFLPVHPR